MELAKEIKTIAQEYGAALVGIASRERLNSAPPSADPDYLLPTTRSVISFAVPHDRKIIRDYLSKKDWLSFGRDRKLQYQKLYTIADRLADFLKEKGFEARGLDANSIYRPEPGAQNNTERIDMVPDFSHRYGAVAAGLGQLGWSGNLMTPQFGSAVGLGSVLTSAVLEPDPLLDENPCDQCKLCTTVCPVEMMSQKETVSVTIADREYTIAKKGNNARCLIGCGGYHGLGPNKKWSTWSPYRVDYPLPEDEAGLRKLCIRIRTADPDKQGKRANLTQREKCFDPNETYVSTCSNCGLICWEEREDREENRRLLLDSGIVAINPDGDRVAVFDEEVTEIATPYIVRAAVTRREYAKAAALSGSQGKGGYTPTDTRVLSLMANR